MPGGLSWAELNGEARTEYWASLALRHCVGLGARSCVRLLRTFGSAYAALQSRQRWREAGLNQKQAAEMATGSWRVTARQEWDRARDLDAHILLWTNPLYPPLLRQLPDAPVLLYCQGDMSLFQAPSFAIVGSRRSTDHGRTVAAHMARCLSSCGVTIISGMALGIDRVAHENALMRIGRSIGVLGTGIDVLYPPGNKNVFDNMQRHGLLVSEFMPGAQPLPEHFPVRNRIISGLALGVLVVEAASRSGSLITARLALEQNREVYAVPGPALDSHCMGCQELVRQGARPVFSAEDVLHDLAEQLRPFGISQASLSEDEKSAQENTVGAQGNEVEAGCSVSTGKGSHNKNSKKNSKPAKADSPAIQVQPRLDAAEQLAPAERRTFLLDCLRQRGPMQADDLACTLNMAVSELNAMLVGLEMLGQVRRLPGARYEAGK